MVTSRGCKGQIFQLPFKPASHVTCNQYGKFKSTKPVHENARDSEPSNVSGVFNGLPADNQVEEAVEVVDQSPVDSADMPSIKRRKRRVAHSNARQYETDQLPKDREMRSRLQWMYLLQYNTNRVLETRIVQSKLDWI